MLKQKKIWVSAPDPKASAEMNVAPAGLFHSNILSISFVEDMKLKKGYLHCNEASKRLCISQ